MALLFGRLTYLSCKSQADVASNPAQPANEKLLPLHNEFQKMR